MVAEENEDSYDIVAWKAFKIDGNRYKPDVYYQLVDGKVQEVKE